jgi:Mor family transcriptional regulator
MKKSSIVIGTKYGFWTVLERKSMFKYGRNYSPFLCRCVCGTERLIESGNLKSGKSKSCGCAISGRDWTPEENEILKQKYFSEPTESLCSLLPKRTYAGIKIQAVKLGLRRDQLQRSGNVSQLLLENPEAYYWSGFIAADGHIDENYRIVVTLSTKDSEHLKKFAKFINTENYREYLDKKYSNCNVSIQDPIKGKAFANKFDFNQTKTITPPNLDWLRGDLFIAFLCGFIDGDGCISKQYGRQDCILTLKGHSSWFNNYLFFENQLYKECNLEKFWNKTLTHINNCGYVTLCFSDRKVLNFLKNKAIELKLSTLNRKWDKIDLSLPDSRYETANRTKAEIVKLYNMGLKQRDIANKLHISNSHVSRIISGRR